MKNSRRTNLLAKMFLALGLGNQLREILRPIEPLRIEYVRSHDLARAVAYRIRGVSYP